MRKIFFLLLAFLLFPATAFAQGQGSTSSAPAQITAPSSDAIRILPVPPQDNPTNLFGQSHYYTLMFRGNGETVVTFKAILSNTGSSPLSSVSLQLPSNLAPNDITAFQVIQERQCLRYITPPPIIYDLKGKVAPADEALYKERCAEYQEPSYQYLYGNTKYLPIQTEVANNSLVLHFPTPIEPNKNGSYFVYLRTNALTQKDAFGAYDYKFETLKTEDKIHALQIGISTDNEHFLRGVKSEVNYAGDAVSMAALPAAAGTERGISSTQFDQFYNQIGNGTLTKQTSDLAANETYEVKGLYADSQTKLYGKEIAITVGVILLLAILLIIIVKVTLKKLARKKTDKAEEAVVTLKNQNKTFLIAVSISFVSMLLVCLYTFGIYAITQLISPNMYYGYSNDGAVLTLFVFAVSALVYLFFFFAPAVGMGVKKGLGWALVTFAATVVWAILFLLVLFALIFFFTPREKGYPQPIPLMGAMESRSATFDAGTAAAPAAAIEPAMEAQTFTVSESAPDSKPVETRTLVEPQTVQFSPAEATTTVAR